VSTTSSGWLEILKSYPEIVWIYFVKLGESWIWDLWERVVAAVCVLPTSSGWYRFSKKSSLRPNRWCKRTMRWCQMTMRWLLRNSTEYIERQFSTWTTPYGVATISRILKIIGLFCKRALQKRLYSAKETYNCKEPTNCSHPIPRHSQKISQQSLEKVHRKRKG